MKMEKNMSDNDQGYYKIKILNNTEDNDFKQLEQLIKEFATDVFIVQNLGLYEHSNASKQKIFNEYKSKVSIDTQKKLEDDIRNRIEFARNSINNTNPNIVTRWYILIKDRKVIGFQTAQVRKTEDKTEGWRNFAYINSKYVGRKANVINTYNELENGFIANIIYENITKWFKENNNVSIERTATGKNMYKNILTYIVYKQFVPEKIDNERVYLVKKYDKIKTKSELKKIFKNYKDGNLENIFIQC